MTMSPVNPGDVVVGRYRVERVLGMGNMGIVVAATQIHLGQRVALKFMLANRDASKAHHGRFLREAKNAARLKTEHAVRILEFGYLDNGSPFMVMEYLDGQDLAAVLAARGQLPIPEAVDYVLQACEAVAEAHSIGIIHRDIKPSNLFLTGIGQRPCVKVLDFGISKLASEEHALTKTGEGVGSPLYMSREQMNGEKNVDGRTDIWSLGVTVYELLAGPGNTPFLADTLPKICMRVFTERPTPLACFRPDVPSALEAVFVQAVEKDRERRFPNVAELAAALAPFGSPRAASYVDRVASVLGEAVAPARPTDPLTSPSQISFVGQVATYATAQGVAGPAPVLPEPSTHPGQAPLAAQATALPAVAGVVPALVGAAPAAATTGSALVRPSGAAAQRRRGVLVVAGLGIGMLAVLLGGLGLMRRVPNAASSASSATSAPAPAPAPPPSLDTATPSVSSVSPPPAATATVTTGPTPSASATVAPSPAPTPKATFPARPPVIRVPTVATHPPPPSGDLYNRGDNK
jgi:serine/threonine-protein kinase